MKKQIPKIIVLIIIIVNISTSSFAQSKKVDTQEQFIEGKYLVKIVINQDKTYGYQIYLDEMQITNVTQKKYFSIPIGYYNIENVKLIAKWHVMRMEKFEETDPFINFEQAKDLGITKEDLEIKLIPKN